MTARSFRVLGVADHDAWSAWLTAIPVNEGENPHGARVRHIAATGETILQIQVAQFFWVCPGCGGTAGGALGEKPVSGWDAPRWVRSGPLSRLTLTPSLGCPLWRRDRCDGHWWLRDGLLELA